MIRCLSLALVAVLGCLSPAFASLTPLRETRLSNRELARVVDGLPTAPARAQTARAEHEFVLTEDTEVKVNGRRCQYSEVPEGAQIIHLEVGPDRKTILRIHFERKKK